MLRLIVVLLVVCMSQVALAEPSAPGLAALSASEPQDPPDVPPRKDTLVFHPCSQCHEYWKTDATPRELAPVHEVGLKHGNGQLWCLVCHDPMTETACTASAAGRWTSTPRGNCAANVIRPARKTGISAPMASASRTGRESRSATTVPIATTPIAPRSCFEKRSLHHRCAPVWSRWPVVEATA